MAIENAQKALKQFDYSESSLNSFISSLDSLRETIKKIRKEEDNFENYAEEAKQSVDQTKATLEVRIKKAKIDLENHWNTQSKVAKTALESDVGKCDSLNEAYKSIDVLLCDTGPVTIKSHFLVFFYTSKLP